MYILPLRSDVAEWVREAEDQYRLQMDMVNDIWRNFARRPEVREMRDALNRVAEWVSVYNCNLFNIFNIKFIVNYFERK